MLRMKLQLAPVIGWQPAGEPRRSLLPSTTVTIGVSVDPSMSFRAFWIVPPSSADWLSQTDDGLVDALIDERAAGCGFQVRAIQIEGAMTRGGAQPGANRVTDRDV